MLSLPFLLGCLGVSGAETTAATAGGDDGGGDDGTNLRLVVGFFSSWILIFFTFAVRSLTGSYLFVLLVAVVLNDMFGSSSPRAIWPTAG